MVIQECWEMINREIEILSKLSAEGFGVGQLGWQPVHWLI